MSVIQDYMIFKFLTKCNGKATKKEIFDAFVKNDDDKRLVEEKLVMMERFGLILVEGNIVSLKKS